MLIRMKGVILRVEQPHLPIGKTFGHRAAMEAYPLIILMRQMVGGVDMRLGMFDMHLRTAIGQHDQVAPIAM